MRLCEQPRRIRLALVIHDLLLYAFTLVSMMDSKPVSGVHILTISSPAEDSKLRHLRSVRSSDLRYIIIQMSIWIRRISAFVGGMT